MMGRKRFWRAGWPHPLALFLPYAIAVVGERAVNAAGVIWIDPIHSGRSILVAPTASAARRV